MSAAAAFKPLTKKEKKEKQAAISESANFPFLGQPLRLTLKDGRLLEGFLAVVDGRGNMILIEAAETRNYSIKDANGKETSVEPVVKSVGFVSANIRDVTAMSKIVFPEEPKAEAKKQKK